ncbi:MAG: hypothetical protein R3A51_10035 [Nannocystaceae bacterium]
MPALEARVDDQRARRVELLGEELKPIVAEPLLRLADRRGDVGRIEVEVSARRETPRTLGRAEAIGDALQQRVPPARSNGLPSASRT